MKPFSGLEFRDPSPSVRQGPLEFSLGRGLSDLQFRESA